MASSKRLLSQGYTLYSADMAVDLLLLQRIHAFNNRILEMTIHRGQHPREDSKAAKILSAPNLDGNFNGSCRMLHHISSRGLLEVVARAREEA